MSDRTRLLLRAARAYAEAGAHEDAARCYDLLGLSWTAAESYRQAGDPAQAAESYRRAGRPEDAARCFRALGRPDLAARCRQEHDDFLGAAWEHLLAGQPRRAEPLLRSADGQGTHGPGVNGPAALRLRLARQVSALLLDGTREPLLALLPKVEEGLTGAGAVRERVVLMEWGVEAADLLTRFDWGARLFHTAHRSLPLGAVHRAVVLARWQEWALRRLGSTAWLPAGGALDDLGGDRPSGVGDAFAGR
ncbi:hypothetical protein [Streptomyces sp. NPDC102476]|uniref:hypothetical protein n=1 Tax=Streptomyces sp. NPDC102476 TaxID=3366181 RepID=UPI00382B2CE7